MTRAIGDLNGGCGKVHGVTALRRQTAVQFLGERVASMGIDTSDERIEEHAEEPCAICGGPSTRGVPLETFVTESLTDQNTPAFPSSRGAATLIAKVYPDYWRRLTSIRPEMRLYE